MKKLLVLAITWSLSSAAFGSSDAIAIAIEKDMLRLGANTVRVGCIYGRDCDKGLTDLNYVIRDPRLKNKNILGIFAGDHFGRLPHYETTDVIIDSSAGATAVLEFLLEQPDVTEEFKKTDYEWLEREAYLLAGAIESVSYYYELGFTMPYFADMGDFLQGGNPAKNEVIKGLRSFAKIITRPEIRNRAVKVVTLDRETVRDCKNAKVTLSYDLSPEAMIEIMSSLPFRSSNKTDF